MNKGRTDVIEPGTVAQLVWSGTNTSAIEEFAKIKRAMLSAAPPIVIVEETAGLRLILPGSGASWREKLRWVREVAHFAVALAAHHDDLVLQWAFSNVELTGADLTEMTDLWKNQGGPPIFSLISLESQENPMSRVNGFASKGLDYFFGWEIEIWPQRPNERKNAFRLATRLASDVLRNGPPQVPAAYADPFDDNRRLELKHRQTGRAAHGPILEIISSEIE